MTAPPMLLVGGGMLAVELAAAAPPGVRLVVLDHAALDVTDRDAVEQVLDRLRPSRLINTAAFTRVDDAERERDAAWRVNAEAPGVLAECCAARGLGIVHFSTDYVFDGEASKPYAEDAPTAPVNFYGETKLAGERAVLASPGRSLVIRSQWLYGSTGRSFPATMMARALERRPTRVVNDQTGRPTSARDLAHATWRLIQADAGGLIHVANRGTATWYDVAQRIFTRAGAVDLLEPCTSAEFPTPARRPRYSVLDLHQLEQHAGIWLPHWTEALDAWR